VRNLEEDTLSCDSHEDRYDDTDIKNDISLGLLGVEAGGGLLEKTVSHGITQGRFLIDNLRAQGMLRLG